MSGWGWEGREARKGGEVRNCIGHYNYRRGGTVGQPGGVEGGGVQGHLKQAPSGGDPDRQRQRRQQLQLRPAHLLALKLRTGPVFR